MNLISQYTEGSDLSDLQKLYDAQCDGQNTKLLELCRSIQRPKISQLDLDDEHAIFSYIAHENLCSIVTGDSNSADQRFSVDQKSAVKALLSADKSTEFLHVNIQKDYTPDSLLQLRSSDAIQYFEIHLKDIPQEGVDRTLVLALFKKIAMSYRTEVDLSLNISNLSRSTFARIGLWI